MEYTQCLRRLCCSCSQQHLAEASLLSLVHVPWINRVLFSSPSSACSPFPARHRLCPGLSAQGALTQHLQKFPVSFPRHQTSVPARNGSKQREIHRPQQLLRALWDMQRVPEKALPGGRFNSPGAELCNDKRSVKFGFRRWYSVHRHSLCNYFLK